MPPWHHPFHMISRNLIKMDLEYIHHTPKQSHTHNMRAWHTAGCQNQSEGLCVSCLITRMYNCFSPITGSWPCKSRSSNNFNLQRQRTVFPNKIAVLICILIVTLETYGGGLWRQFITS